MKIQKLPKVRLACLPTPLERMPNLSKRLDGPNLFIKRDDLIGPAFGGTKFRGLEYLLADAEAKGADIIVTSGSPQGNWCTEVAAAARKLGKQVIIVARDLTGYYPPRIYDHNLLLKKIMGAEIKVVRGQKTIKGPSALWKRAVETAENIAKRLKENGHKPYIAFTDSPLWAAGVANAIPELLSQADREGIVIDYIVHCSAHGGTQAGLILGVNAFDTEIKVVGISNGWENKATVTTRIAEVVNEAARFLEVNLSISPSDVVFFDDYVGKGYGTVDENAIQAIKLVAETEGIFLGPVYTGRAMAGLIDLVRRGYFKAEDNVVFIHTGGMPMLFAYREPITNVLESRKPVWIKPPWIP